MDQRPRTNRAAGIRHGQPGSGTARATSRHARTPAAPELRDLEAVAQRNSGGKTWTLLYGLVTWAAAHDKTERTHTTPLTEAAIAALREAHNLGHPSPWVMPSPRVQDVPVSVKTLATWRRKAMDAAGLSHLRKAGFHCFRRKFASELKDVPLKDLMALGGWRDPKTVIQCYQQADLGRMRERWPTAIHSPNPLTRSLGS